MSLQLRQGSNAERLTITPLSGEPIWTTDTKALYIGDGVTAGGILVASTATGGGTTGTTYVLPTASANTLGGVKIGGGIQIDGSGVITSYVGTGTFSVTAFTSQEYIIDGQQNPVLSVKKGYKYTFNVNSVGHPFWIMSAPGAYNPSNVYPGVANNGTSTGVVTLVVPGDAPATLYYVCQFHSSMAGSINVSAVSSGASGVTGDFTFSGTQASTTATMTIRADAGNTIFNNPFGSVIVGTSGAAIAINGNAGVISMPNNGRVEGVSGNLFALGGVSSITFADNSTLTSASVTAVSTSSLRNNGNVVQLGSTGTLALAGHLELPQRNLQADYNVTATLVDGIQVVVAGGDYPTPEAGWLYNNYTIASVVPLSGNFQLNFDVSLPFTTGTYVLRAYPGVLPLSIKFSDGTVQTTAYTGQAGGTGTVDLSAVAQSIIPSQDANYNLGTSQKGWANVYVDNSVYIGGNALSIGGSPTTLTINGQPVQAAAQTNPFDDFSWTPPLSNPWRTVTYTGTFAASYTQDITSNTLSTTSTNTGTNLTEIQISRLSYPSIDNILPFYNKITLDNVDITSSVGQIRLDRYPNDAVIILTTGSTVTVNDTSTVLIQYTTTGTGAITWFNFANTPDAGANLLGGEIKYQAVVQMNDGNGVVVGKSGTLSFNNPSGQFDQTGFVFGPSTGTAVCSYTEFDPATGFKYQTNLGRGEIDRLKIMWKATLFYNGTWF